MSQVCIKDHEVASVALYEPLPPLLRLDVLPFVFLYATGFYLYFIHPENLFVMVYFACVVFVHALAFLSSEWSLDMKCWMGYLPISNLNVNTENRTVFVKVVPTRNTLPKMLCPLFYMPKEQAETKLATGETLPRVWFSYQKLNFCLYNNLENCFYRLDFPTNSFLTLYQQTQGYTKENDQFLGKLKWGPNDFDIPIPKFLELLKEQLVAPFFVFQFFCMLLWCLDEYVYYSLLTLLMLIVFECTVVKQRQTNMETLNHMRRAPQRLLVYRSKKWMLMWSDVLIPGDICSIGNNTQYGGGGGSATGTGTGEDDVEANAGVIVPCDILLLTGSCVVNESMLSGESTPLRKEALEIETSSEQQLRLEIDEGTSMQHKKHVLYGGTRVLQHTCSTTSKRIKIPSPPDNGCIAYVLRTGFGTTQGSLMRTILYSSQRVTANNAEAMWFILFLLCFAVIASIYVLQEGLKDASRSRFKLLLHCIMIITSVVPPELPMELSLAVTNSLIALTKRNIFCTEPFRIPFAGRIDICCFDKTGTLTSDELIMEGVVGLSNTSITTSSSSSSSSSNNNNSHSQDQNRNRQEEMNIISSSNLPFETEIILAGCHSLMLVKGQIVGDPMEKAVFKEIKWKLTNQGGHLICPSSTNRHRTRHDPPQEDFSMEILHRFAFSSELKRMSTIVSILELENKNTKKKTKKIRLLSKGAPEVMEPLFQQIPTFYTKVYRHFASKGNRMIALGYRDITFSQIENIRRQEIEKDMIFAGFLMLNCPLKEDTKHIIHDLLFAQHQIMMITGDNALTACEVARQVGILDATKQQTLVCSKETVGALQWTTILKEEQEEKKKNFEFDQLKLPQLVKKYNLCMTGICLSWLYDDMMTQDKKTIKTTDTTDETSTCSRKQEEKWMHFLEKICIHIVVFARISPKQKEQILIALNRTGKITAMCGDGTNDVGALKQAHVGMSIINNPLLEQNIRSLRQSLKTDTNTNTDADADADDKESAEEAFQMVNMIGDASIASPFTSKSSSIRAIKELIRQGRCTLVTTIQMFKILGINCLVTAFYLSFLYMYGVKNGDQQLTIVGLGIAMFFFFLSRTRPAKKLSAQRPPSGVFCWRVMVSMIGQFMIHLFFLFKSLQVTQPFIDHADPSMHPDGKFRPNVINTVMFLVSCIMQVTTFVANYKGQPFMEKLTENKLLFQSVVVSYSFLFMAVFEILPFLNETLKLVPFPTKELARQVCMIMVGDTIVTLGFEWILS